MDLFYNYENPVCNEAPVVFSSDPSITFLKELLIYELSQMSYYEEKLRELGEDTEKYTDIIINYITLAVVNLDYRKDRLLNLLKNLYQDIQNLLQIYKSLCNKYDTPFEPIIGEKLSFDRKAEKIKAVNFGEKQSLLKNTVMTANKKIMNEIAIILISNVCLCITELENYEINAGTIKFNVPQFLKTINYDVLKDSEFKSKIYEFAKTNFEIIKELNRVVLEKYGPVNETDVDLGIKKGKCILVSGHYYKNLAMLLEALKDEDINVYTHSQMIYAHSFSYFQKFKNLAGHYQRSINNTPMDFATFPGVILLTQNSYFNFNMIRGRIFTPDNNPAYGLNKISENDFAPLIKAAKEEKGFTENHFQNGVSVGYNETEIKEKLHKIINGILKGKYKQLIIIGNLSNNIPLNEYFADFFGKLPEDWFVITFSYNQPKDNIWHITPLFDLSMVYIILDELKNYKQILKKQTSVFIPQCHLQAISHAFNIKIHGVKNIFLGECCSNFINPSLLNGLEKLFNIKQISNSAEKDINCILGKK